MKHAKFARIVSPFLLTLLLSATGAYAGTLPPAVYTVSAEGTAMSGPGSLTGTTCNSDGCGTGSASATVGTFLSASGETSGGLYAPAGVGSAELGYFWEVIGLGGPAVPVTIVGDLSTSATRLGAHGGAEIQVYVGGLEVGAFPACSSTYFSCSSLGLGPPSVSINDLVSVSPGQVNLVQMDAYAGAALYGVAGSGSGSATADPVISIDPTWLATHPGYSLEFRPGITNGATPEPSTLLLLGSGLLTLGYGVRRRLTK
jgi:hypothetical protein